ncbi:ABC transporter substrate-binding protein [bacterium AH-315-E10]|nr:ABC transporter substrate-binding protein [bacterium AH-315-E10]
MSKRYIFIVIFVIALFTGTFVMRQHQLPSADAVSDNVVPSQPVAVERIISLAPSITEMLFALGLGDKVVGVTRFCSYPEVVNDTARYTRVGGIVDTDYEAIMRLKPDLVVLQQGSGKQADMLDKAGIVYCALVQSQINDIMTDFLNLGRVTDRSEQANRIVTNLRQRISKLQQGHVGKKRLRVLIVIGRDYSSDPISRVTVAGFKSFYNDMLHILNCENAYQGKISWPDLTTEGLMKCNPDVIVELIADHSRINLSNDELIEQWKGIPQLNACKAGQVSIYDDGYEFIPGPRFILTLEKLAVTVDGARLKYGE